MADYWKRSSGWLPLLLRAVDTPRNVGHGDPAKFRLIRLGGQRLKRLI